MLETLADWNNYLSTSLYPATAMAPLFNPGSQRLAIDAYVQSNWGNESIIQVCDDGTAIHVVISENPGCYGNPPAFSCAIAAFQAVVVPNNGEPVLWDIVHQSCPPWIL